MAAGTENSVDLQLQWIAASSQLSDRSLHRDPVDLVNNYIEQGETLTGRISGSLREQHLLRMLAGLIECATDPLTPDILKQLCLDNLHRPSGKLRTLYRNNPPGLRKLNRIHHSITTLYNHCSHHC